MEVCLYTMAEAEHWKRMFTESGRDCFVSKYKIFELKKQLEESVWMEVERKFETLNTEIKSLHNEVMEFNRTCNEQSEIEGYKNRVSELENQEAFRLIDELDLKHLLEDVKIKYDGLLVEFQENKIECELIKSELKELSESKIGVGNELKEYEMMCNRWKEQRNKSLEEEKRIASERDKEEKQRIISLEEDIRKMGSDQREKCVEFRKEIMDLKCANRRAEDDIHIWKKKFTDSECGKRRAEDEIEIWKKKFTDSQCENQRAEDEIEIWKKKYTDLECEKRRVDVEIDLLKIKCMELEIQASEMLNHGAELEDYKTKCHNLWAELKEKETQCVDLHHELKVYKIKCNGMEEKVMALAKEGKIISEREEAAHGKISYLEAVIKKMKSDETDLCDQLKSENKVLECGKKRAEDEIDVLKKKFMKLKKELEDYTSKCHGLATVLEVKEMECVDFELTKGELKELSESKIGVENEIKEYEIMCNRLKEQIIKILEDKRIASERDKEDKGRIIMLEEEIKKMGSDQREKCVEFSKEIMDLKCANQRAEDEIETWKKKYIDLEVGKRRTDDEIELVKKKCRELEIQASEMLNHGAELEDYKTKCHGLSTMIKVKEMECVDFEGKLKNLMLTKGTLDHELEDHKTTCGRMKEEIAGLTKIGKIMSEREKTSHERIACLEELVKKMEIDEKDMLVQLKNEDLVLKRGKKRAEDETENWKKRFSELEMGLGSLPKEVGYDDICEKYMDEYISRKTDGRVNVASVAHMTKSEKVLSPAFLPSTNFSSFHGNFEDVHASDTPNIKNQCDHSANFEVGNKNIRTDTKVELVSETRQQLGSETGGSCKANLDLLKQDSVATSSTYIIEIDSEDEIIEVR